MILLRLIQRVVRKDFCAAAMSAATVGLLAGCEHAIDQSSAAAEEPDEAGGERIEVHVVAVEKRNFYETVSALGECEAIPEKLAILTPAVEGQVGRILARRGTLVKAGQPIVEFDKSIAQADLAEKSAIQKGLVASLKLLTSLPRPEEQQISKLAIEHAKITVTEAEAIVSHLRPLRERHEVSEQKFFEAEQALAQARLQQQTAEAQYQLSMSGPRPEAIDEAQAKIDVAEKGASLSQSHLNLLTISAPIDGVLDSLDCHPGQTIAAGTVIGEVVDASSVFATAWLPAASAHRIRVGQPGRVRHGSMRPGSPARAVNEATNSTGQVVFVGKVADPQTGNLPIRIEVDNSHAQMAIGETLEVVVAVSEPKTELSVPAAAITDIGEGPVLSVVRDGKTVVLHPEVGSAFEGWVPVSAKDLLEGDVAIVAGGYNLPEGTEVEAVGNEKDEHE